MNQFPTKQNIRSRLRQ